MKEKLHPEFFEVDAVCACGNAFKTYSTKKTGLKVEICSACHSFYTGTKKEVAQTGRVERFKNRMAKAKTPQKA